MQAHLRSKIRALPVFSTVGRFHGGNLPITLIKHSSVPQRLCGKINDELEVFFNRDCKDLSPNISCEIHLK
jgi:hypothetical protein